MSVSVQEEIRELAPKCALVIGIKKLEGWLVLKMNVFGIGNLYMVENIFFVDLSQPILAFYTSFTPGVNADLPSVGSLYTVAAILFQMPLHVCLLMKIPLK